MSEKEWSVNDTREFATFEEANKFARYLVANTGHRAMVKCVGRGVVAWVGIDALDRVWTDVMDTEVA